MFVKFSNMISIYFLVFLIYSKCEKCFAFLSQEEQNITEEFIKEHHIRCLILIEGTSLSVNNLNKLKTLKNLNIPFSYLSGAKILESFSKETPYYINTLIVFKEPNIYNVAIVLNYLLMSQKLGFFYMFKWILFPGKELTITEEQQLPIPYDCLFLIIYPKDFNVYYLKEIYQIRGKIFSMDYGFWNNAEGLVIKNSFIYTRRFDLNGSALILLNQRVQHCAWFTWARECVSLQILVDCAQLTNVRLYAINQGPFGDIYALAYPFDYTAVPDQYGFLSPLFKVSVNWYIRMPSYLEEADYYIRPFSIELWIYIFGCLIVGIGFGVISYLIYKRKQNHLKLVDLVFLALDSMCNQDGFNGNKQIFFRLAKFSFRVFALFIISAYSGTILSYLAVRRLVLPFDSLDGLVENGKYVIATYNFTFPRTYFQRSKDPLIREIFENHFVGVGNRSKIFLEKLFCDELVAFAALDNDFNEVKLRCKIYRLKQPISYVLSSIGIAKHSPFTRVFNYILVRLFSSGIQQKLQKVVLREGITTPEIESNFNSVPVSQMVQVLLIVPIGITIALIIFLCELIWGYIKKLKNREKNQVFNRRNNAARKRLFRIRTNFQNKINYFDFH